MDSLVKQISDIIVSEIDPEKIILFGSRAMNQDNQDSDYDFLIIKSFSGNHRPYLKKVYTRLVDFDVPVDLILISENQLEENNNNKYFIYKNAIQNGKSVYEKKRIDH